MTSKKACWLGFALPLALVAGLEISCFNPPSDDVSFSCDLDSAPRCPAGYSCERDGCCHREGSDVDADLGACALGGGGTGPTGTGTESTDTSGTQTGGESTDTTTG